MTVAGNTKLATLAGAPIVVAMINLVACDEPPSAGGAPPKILSLIVPPQVDAGEDVILEVNVNGDAAVPLTVKWQLAGPGRVSASEYKITDLHFTWGDTSSTFWAPTSPGRTTIQLTLENSVGFDQAERTIQTGYEAPYLSSLKFIDVTGQEKPIEVPELAAPVLVHPGDQFSLVAEAVDYNGFPLSYSWWSSNDASVADNCARAGAAFDVVSSTEGPAITLVAPKAFCNTQLNLTVYNGKSTWQHAVATLQVAATQPQVKSIAAPALVGPGATITLSADVTYDPATSISYDWSLAPRVDSQQSWSNDATASFVLGDDPQSYLACLEITDGYGQHDSNCIDLVVPSDWQLEGALSPTSYINVPTSNSIDSIAINDAIVLERLDRTTHQTAVINAIANAYGTSWNKFYYAAGAYFGMAASSLTTVHRLDAPSLSDVSNPNHASLFTAAGKLWAFGDSNAIGYFFWQYLNMDSWQAGGQTDQLASTVDLPLQTAVGRDDGQFLLLFSGASSAIFECNIWGDCQSLGTISATIQTAPIALGWASDGRAIVLHGLKAWRHETLGWVQFSRSSPNPPVPVLATGDGQACQAAAKAYGSDNWSVWCLGEQGWQLVGLANVATWCNKAALAVAQGTAYFACDGRLYSHSISP